MAETSTQDAPSEAGAPTAGREERRAKRQMERLARRIRSFAKTHGGAAQGHIAHIGRDRVRLVLVGEDGRWGDLVAPEYLLARGAAELAGITVHESFDGELAAKVRTGMYEWKRMAGIQVGGSADR